jgi:hypothetical protein
MIEDGPVMNETWIAATTLPTLWKTSVIANFFDLFFSFFPGADGTGTISDLPTVLPGQAEYGVLAKTLKKEN